MNTDDEAEFLKFASGSLGLQVTPGTHHSFLQCPSGQIGFERCRSNGNTLISGRIALATTDRGGFCEDPANAAQIERVYKQLRRWLQKVCTNDLVCYNDCMPEHERKTIRVPMFWIGPKARIWLLENPHAELRQFTTGAVVFDIESRKS
jgi:hypothetical protein